MNWKDVSSYSQSDKIREINAVEIIVGPLKIAVHRHIYHPGKWVLSLHCGWIDKRELKADALDDAKAEAVEIVKAEVTTILAALAAS